LIPLNWLAASVAGLTPMTVVLNAALVPAAYAATSSRKVCWTYLSLRSNALETGLAGASVDPEDARKFIIGANLGWDVNPAPVVHDSFASAPPEVQQAVRDSGGDESTGCIYHKGKVHVFISNHGSVGLQNDTTRHSVIMATG
jgi:hypothetical protein